VKKDGLCFSADSVSLFFRICLSQPRPVNWVIAAVFMFGIIVGIIAWVMLRRIEKAYKKTAGYVAPDRQLRL
jgi:hypothetical protein